MTIAEVSKKYDITPDTLRYYERIGLIPPVPRTKGGVRNYDETSCGWVELMKCMRSAGVQIEALIEYVALFRRGEDTAAQRKAIADGISESLAVIKSSGVSAAEANQLFIFTQWTDMMSEFARNGRQTTVVLPSDFSQTASMFEQMLVAQETEGDDEFVIVEEEPRA